ncbi:MAG: gluconate 2-dehydrogenase subunit 3 family protein, partial [Steroidobacteraceae bacterium]
MTAALGGAALVGGDALLAFSFDGGQRTQASQGVGTFPAADIALLDEIAETILPETSTPGAKAAKTGAFMA